MKPNVAATTDEQLTQALRSLIHHCKHVGRQTLQSRFA